ncbi:carbohydrate ABC transporter permease [Synoicihabitans lomoniglobus]|uniref:Sugar ABC transporter permease n=1 Tax=Synoicihabitans lomoniglobus TaxID=2909285 RepID=A0AAF0CPD8_9BACT|nr:sugar ABC transporter permease [Opitutaceae bacterium LMO-M01]WED64219.1 sugar ABC transporter permease [Opitutaceae bacterium LMO-M01]
MKPTRLHAAWAPWVFTAPFLLLFLLFTAWPLLQSLVLAFQQTFGPRSTRFVGFDNFAFLLRDPLFWQAVRNTVIYTAGAIFVQLPVALGLALLLNRPQLRGRALFRLIFFSPSLVGLVFVGLMFHLMFQKHTGLINAGLHTLFSSWDPEFAWLDAYIMPSLIIASVWLYAGFNMIYFLAALQNVNRELMEAAEIDGAGPWARFRHVVLPEIRPVAGFVVLLSVIGSFQLFELPWVLLNNSGGPGNNGLTIVMYLFQTGFLTGDLGYASAIGWVLGLILVGAAWAQARAARKEISG